MSKSDNLSVLRALAADVRSGLAVDAVRAGQLVLEVALRARVPVRTGHLRSTIRSTAIGVTPRRMTGTVIVPAVYTLHVEGGTRFMRAERFIRDTIDADGPQAVRAMAKVLQRGS